MLVRRHCENVPGAYPIRRSALEIDTNPEPTPEEKRLALRAAALKQGAVIVEPEQQKEGAD
jgi:hypothetical protein